MSSVACFRTGKPSWPPACPRDKHVTKECVRPSVRGSETSQKRVFSTKGVNDGESFSRERYERTIGSGVEVSAARHRSDRRRTSPRSGYVRRACRVPPCLRSFGTSGRDCDRPSTAATRCRIGEASAVPGPAAAPWRRADLQVRRHEPLDVVLVERSRCSRPLIHPSFTGRWLFPRYVYVCTV